MKRRSMLGALGAAGIAVTAFATRAAEQIQRFPDVLSAKVRLAQGGAFDFDVTVSSPYDTAQRYADGIRAKGKDGTIFGVRKLFHDHADEQPFTRDLYDVKVPAGVRTVIIEGRDKKFGYGGNVVEVVLPGR